MMLIRPQGAGEWRQPATTAYGDEGELQALIASSPSLLPGVEGKEVVAVATEVAVPGVGSADVVVVDAAGDVTVVECKLAQNAEIRRTVVGQIFAYAGGLWGLSFEELAQAFAARGVELSAPVADDEEPDDERFREAVARTLADGSFRLVIAVDAITDELKTTVTYLNRHTTPGVQIVALELRRAADHGVEILIPTTFGEESAREKKPGSQRRRSWDEPSLIDAIRAKHPGEAGQRMIALYKFMRDRGARLTWGTGKAPSVTARLGIDSGRPVSISFYADDGVAVNFGYVQTERSAEDMKALLDLVRDVPGAEPYLAGVESSGYKKLPKLRVEDVLASDEALEAFKRAIDLASAPRDGGPPGAPWDGGRRADGSVAPRP